MLNVASTVVADGEQEGGEEGAGEGDAEGQAAAAEGDGVKDAAPHNQSIQDAMAVQSAAGDMKTIENTHMNSRSSLGGGTAPKAGGVDSTMMQLDHTADEDSY